MYAEIITVTENSAVIAFSTGCAGFVSWEIQGLPEIRSIEAADCGRLACDRLAPDTTYSSVFRTEKGESCSLSFHTLPKPEGKELDRIFLTADWHISKHPENRKGRCFIESETLALETLFDAESLHPDVILNAGDLTNKGIAEEYEAASGVLKHCKTRFFPVPGNHDYPERGLWEKYIGPRSFRLDLPGGPVLGIDTSDYLLHADDAARMEAELDRSGKITVLSHYQLFAAPEIDHAPDLHIHNASDFPSLFAKLAASPSILWCGHQNICTISRLGRTIQLNLPQTPQWPCGSLLIRRFSNGTYHTFQPIRSEVLRQWCRTAGNDAAAYYGERQWTNTYRFRDYTRANFFLPEAEK